MARTLRQSKILELIAKTEIETQDELSQALKNAGVEVTQATISRDIKELGLIKIQSEKTKKYKYAVMNSNQPTAVSNRFSTIFKEAVVTITQASNLVVVKTIKGMASAISSVVDKLAISNVLGCVFGDDTVMVIVNNENNVKNVIDKLNNILYV